MTIIASLTTEILTKSFLDKKERLEIFSTLHDSTASLSTVSISILLKIRCVFWQTFFAF